MKAQEKGRQPMRNTWMLSTLAAAAMMIGCGSDPPTTLLGGTSGGLDTTPTQEDPDGDGITDEPPETTVLDDRVVDYNEALRTASLKLLRRLPTLAQIKKVETALDPKLTYEQELDAMLADPAFQERMIKWWRDVMRQGGGAVDDRPSRDTAPVFAARVMMEERSFTELFTATSNTCPSYDSDARAFVDGECNNGVTTHAGVLTDPGVMHQFYGNMAFRRVRWVQEVFVCTKFPAEYSPTPEQIGGTDYISPWNFDSVATEPINFQDTKSVICANCHTTINHIAPLFANFDAQGNYQASIQVMTPTVPEPVSTELAHWLQPGETTHWRHGQPVASLPALGQAIADDPDVAECAVARMWNFTMSKEDIVNDLSTVPPEVLAPYLSEFTSNGMNLKQVLRSMFTSDDFVRF